MPGIKTFKQRIISIFSGNVRKVSKQLRHRKALKTYQMLHLPDPSIFCGPLNIYGQPKSSSDKSFYFDHLFGLELLDHKWNGA